MPFTDLPFAKRRSNGTIDAWSVEPTGDYEADCDTGRTYFQQLRLQAEEKKHPLLLGFVMQAMVERGRVSGIEVGFLSGVNALALSA